MSPTPNTGRTGQQDLVTVISSVDYKSKKFLRTCPQHPKQVGQLSDYEVIVALTGNKSEIASQNVYCLYLYCCFLDPLLRP